MMEDFLTSSVMTDISNLDLPKTELDTELDVKPDFNPWNVPTLEDFLFYNCPECPHKCRSSISFTNHAVKNHPKAKEKFGDAYEEGDVPGRSFIYDNFQIKIQFYFKNWIIYSQLFMNLLEMIIIQILVDKNNDKIMHE